MSSEISLKLWVDDALFNFELDFGSNFYSIHFDMIDGGIAHGLSGLDLMDASKKLLPMLFFI